MNITIEHTSLDGLQQEAWTFYAWTDYSLGLTVRLNQYHIAARTTKRHKWQPNTLWTDRVPRGTSYTVTVLKERPEIPDDVKAEVVKRITESITFAP